jgi:hypothetical protein
MAQFLSNSQHILTTIDDVITHAKDVVYFVSPEFSEMPESTLRKVYEALARRVKIVVIYREAILKGMAEMLLLLGRNVNFYRSSELNTSAYFSEKEAVLTSFQLFVPSSQVRAEFGVFFKKAYSGGMHDELVKECNRLQTSAARMVIDNNEVLSWEEAQARKPKIDYTVSEPVIATSDKKLTVKEKQKFILNLFARECKDCNIKIEGEDRLRLYGKGIALALTKERIDIIFVQYNTYIAKMEDVKQFVTAKHPKLKVWFQYNRINMNLESENEIESVFPTLRHAMTSFQLLEQ